MNDWIAHSAEAIAKRAPRELEALIGVSTTSGDVEGAKEAAALCAALLPADAVLEELECSSPAHAPDMLARVQGSGDGRLLLLGHLDTVVARDAHRALERNGDELVGSGAIDMKGGDVLALGVLRELSALRDRYAELALLFVVDEEWRTAPFAHAERFEGFDACLCFEGGELDVDGNDAVVVRRKAAATIHVAATGRAAHSGSAPEAGVNALLAIAAAAQAVAACNDPAGPHRLTAVPTVARAGDAFNVVPGAGELICDLRADHLSAFQSVIDSIPAQFDGALLQTRRLRAWPAMDSEAATAPLLAAASELLSRPIATALRGGASDASHMAEPIPVTIDGLGPLGGGAHASHEHVVESSFQPRAELALAIALVVLDAGLRNPS